MLIRVLEGKGNLGDIPNLTVRGNDDSIVTSPVEYIDVNAHPSPRFHGFTRSYLMNRCEDVLSFVNSVRTRPRHRCGVTNRLRRSATIGWNIQRTTAPISSGADGFHVHSTAQKGFKHLLEVLPNLGIDWEAYSRANVIKEKEIVDNLEASRCKLLFIGFRVHERQDATPDE